MKKAQNPFVIENLPLFFVFVFKIGNKFPPCLKSKQYVGTNKHYQGEKFYNNNNKKKEREDKERSPSLIKQERNKTVRKWHFEMHREMKKSDGGKSYQLLHSLREKKKRAIKRSEEE